MQGGVHVTSVRWEAEKSQEVKDALSWDSSPVPAAVSPSRETERRVQEHPGRGVLSQGGFSTCMTRLDGEPPRKAGETEEGH